MRDIHIEKIQETVAKLCMDSNYFLGDDIKNAFIEGQKLEKDFLSKDVLSKLLENAEIAKDENIPICQDTGMTVVYIKVGQEVHITGGNITDAINKGVKDGYEKGFLRKSVVKDPIDRINTKTNTPAVIHFEIVDGDNIHIVVAPKGFGSENMSALKMLKPSDGIDGVKNFIIETVKKAGPNACPPIIVGVGVGGTMEKAALISKEALLRTVSSKNPNNYWSNIECELLEKINALGIGPAGFGGITTALAVHIETYATHIAGLPVSVNIGCNVTRHAEAII